MQQGAGPAEGDKYRIVELTERHVAGAARVLHDAFRTDHPAAWPSLEEAEAEVRESLDEGRMALAALIDGEVAGWIGAIPQYEHTGWELHPLAVDPAHQRMGVGTALVRELARRVTAAGGSVLYAGSDDESFQTSISGVDLFPGVLAKLATIQNLRGHPYSFYLARGFEVAGVIPDANGPGKPDIIVAMSLRRGAGAAGDE